MIFYSFIYLAKHLSSCFLQQLVQCCENCFTIPGSIEQQLAHLLKVDVDAVPFVPSDVKNNAAAECSMMCSCVCGTVYCSEKCRTAAWERFHCLLCTGHPDTPMHDFMHHCIGSDVSFTQKGHSKNDKSCIYVFPTETNEIFLLAAQVNR